MLRTRSWVLLKHVNGFPTALQTYTNMSDKANKAPRALAWTLSLRAQEQRQATSSTSNPRVDTVAGPKLQFTVPRSQFPIHRDAMLRENGKRPGNNPDTLPGMCPPRSETKPPQTKTERALWDCPEARVLVGAIRQGREGSSVEGCGSSEI